MEKKKKAQERNQQRPLPGIFMQIWYFFYKISLRTIWFSFVSNLQEETWTKENGAK